MIPTVAAALSKNIEQTRESGHNIIFAALAIRALRDHPMYATPALVAGMRKLIEGFHTAHPGRGYYGRERGWLYGQNVSLPEDDRFPPYRDESQMVRVVIDELIGSANVRRQGFGGLWHIFNHAAALTELSRFGLPPAPVQNQNDDTSRTAAGLSDLGAQKGPLHSTRKRCALPAFANSCRSPSGP